jgi:hypothetical protein
LEHRNCLLKGIIAHLGAKERDNGHLKGKNKEDLLKPLVVWLWETISFPQPSQTLMVFHYCYTLMFEDREMLELAREKGEFG